MAGNIRHHIAFVYGQIISEDIKSIEVRFDTSLVIDVTPVDRFFIVSTQEASIPCELVAFDENQKPLRQFVLSSDSRCSAQ